MNPKTARMPADPPARPTAAPAVSLDVTLEMVDPRIAGLIAAETDRQRQKLVFIASESLCPKAVREAVGSPFSNLYAEGDPSTRMAVHERELLDWDARNLAFYRRYADRRYYKGCDYANLVEAEAIRRVAELFATETIPSHSIFANVQPLSGAAANNAVYEALVPAESTVMGMHLSTGGHLTHGSPVNRSGKHFRIVPYVVDPSTGRRSSCPAIPPIPARSTSRPSARSPTRSARCCGSTRRTSSGSSPAARTPVPFRMLTWSRSRRTRRSADRAAR